VGCQELVEALRSAAAARIQAVWREAEEEGGKIREEVRERIRKLSESDVKAFSSESLTECDKIVLLAARQARMKNLSSQKALSDRLYMHAMSRLSLLRNEDYEKVFRGIADEFPRLPWQTVKVNPRDQHIARDYFPNSIIMADEHIAGGAEALTEAGKLRIINTFEKRLERAWADILPSLLKDVFDEVSDEGFSPGP